MGTHNDDGGDMGGSEGEKVEVGPLSSWEAGRQDRGPAAGTASTTNPRGAPPSGDPAVPDAAAAAAVVAMRLAVQHWDNVLQVIT